MNVNHLSTTPAKDVDPDTDVLIQHRPLNDIS
jgi:hypothetical protein